MQIGLLDLRAILVSVLIFLIVPTISLAAPITISPSVVYLDSGMAGSSYSEAFTAAGGAGTYTFSLKYGELPDGLRLSPEGGLSGTPSRYDHYSFTIGVRDSQGNTGERAYIMLIRPNITISPLTLPHATSGTFYSQQMQVSGARQPYDIAIDSGRLPAGMTLSRSGLLSGTARDPGEHSVLVVVNMYSKNGAFYEYRLYKLSVDDSLPVVGDVALDVAYDSDEVQVPLRIIEGTPVSVAVASSPANGDAVASGITISYKPRPGFYGIDSFTYTVTDASGTSLPARVTVTVGAPPPPVAQDLTFEMKPEETRLGFSLLATGAGPFQFRMQSQPQHLRGFSFLADGTGTYERGEDGSGRPFKGTDTFTYQAVGPGGVSNTARVTINVLGRPAPVATDDTQRMVANSSANIFVTRNDSGVIAEIAIDRAPAHGTVSVSLPNVLVYTPAANFFGTDSFTYVASGPDGTSAPATVTVTVMPAPVPTVTAHGAKTAAGVAVAIDLAAGATGGPFTAATLVSPPADGVTAVAGTVVTYTPPGHAAGEVRFGYRISNPFGDSLPGVVTITVEQPTFVFSPVAGALPRGTVGTPYNGLTIIAATAAPVTRYDVTSGGLPEGLKFDGATGTISGVATTAGANDFTVTATDANGAVGTSAYSITIVVPAPTSSDSNATVAANSTGNSIPLNLGGGAADTLSIGTRPAHGIATASGLAITYTPAPGYSGVDSFTYIASNATGPSTAATVTITVTQPILVFSPSSGSLRQAMAGEAYSQPISAEGGAAPLLYRLASGTLPKGMVLNISTGELTGPLAADAGGDYAFTIGVRDNNGATGTVNYTLNVRAIAITVTDKVVDVPAGSAPSDVYLNSGATGGPFIGAEATFVEPEHAGTASIIQGELAQVGPVAPPVGWYLKFIPNKAYSGQVRIGFRLVSALGASNTGTVTYKLAFDASKHAEEINALVRNFLQTRQNLIASTIKVPGLIDRRRMAAGTETLTSRMTPSTDGVTLGFSTSLAQMKAARDRADGIEQAEISPFNIWLDGTVLMHRRKDQDDRWGNFGMVSLGADYLLSEKALLGLSFHYDRMTDPTDEDMELFGNGWLAGPYASFEIGKGIFWDTSLLYGGSSNTIDANAWDGTFGTRRLLMDTAIKGQWQLDGVTVFTPALRAVYFSETVDDYGVKNGAGNAIDIEGFTEEQLRVSLRAEIARQFTLESDLTLTPRLAGTVGYSELDGEGVFGSLSAGLSINATQGWAIDAGLLLNVEGNGEKSVGAKVGISGRM